MTKMHQVKRIDGLPTPLSNCLSRLTNTLSSISLATLFYLRDAVECSLRLLTAVGVADLLHQYRSDPTGFEALVKNSKIFSELLGSSPPTLGTIIRVLNKLGNIHPASPVLRCVNKIMHDPGGGWHELFSTDSEKKFLDFRNNTIGHGACTPTSDYAGQIEYFLPLLWKFVECMDRHLWGKYRIIASGICWEGLEVEDDQKETSAWFHVYLVSKDEEQPGGEPLVLNPLVRGSRQDADSPANLMLLNYIDWQGKNPHTIGAFFLDYLRGSELMCERPFTPVIERYFKYISGSM